MRMKQHGFTLVEISIVLVIIGLILGGILGAQSLIRSMQAKDVVSIVGDLRTSTAYFKQRYNYLPGDFPIATATDIPNVATPGGNGNGSLAGAINATGQAAVNSEVAEAPWHLFNAGFISKIDSADPQRRIKSNFGAVHIAALATVNGLVPGFAAANPTARNAIVFFNLPCDVVTAVDSQLDDGVTVSPGGRAFGTACPAGGGIVTWYAVAL